MSGDLDGVLLPALRVGDRVRVIDTAEDWVIVSVDPLRWERLTTLLALGLRAWDRGER